MTYSEPGLDSFPCGATLLIWKLKDDQLERVAHIPAMGDCAYPGIISSGKDTIWISYYSMHAYLLGVCQQLPDNPRLKAAEKTISSDIFLAEVSL